MKLGAQTIRSSVLLEKRKGYGYYEKELFVSDISAEIFIQIKRDHLLVRIYVEESDLSKVKRLEIKE